MAKFCSNCGEPLEDGIKFCASCGAKVEETEAAAPQVEETEAAAPQVEGEISEPANEPKKLSVSFKVPDFKNITKEDYKKYGKIAGIALACLVAFIVLLSAVFSGPRAVVKKFVKGMNGNVNAIVDVMPPFYFEAMDMTKKEYKEELREEFEDRDDDEKIKCKIKKVEKLSSSDAEEYRTMFEMIENVVDDFDASDIKKFKSVTVKLTYDGETETEDIIVFKYKGKWYIADMFF